MWRVPLLGFEHRFVVLVLAALLTGGSLFALPGLRLDVSSDGLVAPQSPLYEIERRIDARFGRVESRSPSPEPAAHASMREHLRHDQRVILPATAALLLTILAFAYRNLPLAAFPVINGALATVWGLAAMALLRIPVNLLSASLPALVLVVGGTEDVRIANEFRGYLRRHDVPRLALFATVEQLGIATLLNNLTTVIGFAATAVSSLPVLRDFGIAAAVTLALRFVCTVFLLPAELSLSVRALRGEEHGPATHAATTYGARLAERIVARLAPRGRTVIAALAVVCVLGAVAASQLTRQNNLHGIFDEGGPLSVELSPKSGDFADPESLARLESLAASLRTVPGVESVSEPQLTADGTAARLLVRTSFQGTEALTDLAGAIRGRVASREAGRYDFAIGGRSLTLADAADTITASLVSSLALAAFFLFAIVAVMFLSLRVGLTAILVNLVAVMLMFVLMFVLGIPLNIGTCMVAAVTLGLVIADTLHLLVRYNRALRVHRNEAAGIKAAFEDEAGPMLASAAALAGGFAMLGLSQFAPVRQFGLLSAAVVGIGVVVEAVVSPVLLANTRVITLWDLLGMTLRQKLQEESPFFAGFTRWQAKRLVLASDVSTFTAGEVIVRTGDAGHVMHVILSGEVEVVRYDDRRSKVVSRLGVGDVFGEIALLTGVPRTADAVAVTEVRALTYTRDSLDSLRRFSPLLASKLMLNLGQLVARRLAPTAP